MADWTVTCPNGHTGPPDRMIEEYVAGERDGADFMHARLKCPECGESEEL